VDAASVGTSSDHDSALMGGLTPGYEQRRPDPTNSEPICWTSVWVSPGRRRAFATAARAARWTNSGAYKSFSTAPRLSFGWHPTERATADGWSARGHWPTR